MKPISFPLFLSPLAAAGAASPGDLVAGFSQLLLAFQESPSPAGSKPLRDGMADAQANVALVQAAFGTIRIAPDAARPDADAHAAAPGAAGSELPQAPSGSDAGPKELSGAPIEARPQWLAPVVQRPAGHELADIVSDDGHLTEDEGSAPPASEPPTQCPAPLVGQALPMPPEATTIPAASGPANDEIHALLSTSPGREIRQPTGRPDFRNGADEQAAIPTSSHQESGSVAMLFEQHGLAAPFANHGKAGLSGTATNLANASAAGLPDSDFHQLDALIRDIAEVSGSSARAAFRIAASELGRIDVRLHASDAGMSINIRTDSEHSHSAVAGAQGQLSDDMRANGLKVATTNVSLGQSGAERQRDERQSFARPAFIESADTETEQSQSSFNDQRPRGRYA